MVTALTENTAFPILSPCCLPALIVVDIEALYLTFHFGVHILHIYGRTEIFQFTDHTNLCKETSAIIKSLS